MRLEKKKKKKKKRIFSFTRFCSFSRHLFLSCSARYSFFFLLLSSSFFFFFLLLLLLFSSILSSLSTDCLSSLLQVAMRALGFEVKKAELQRIMAENDHEGTGFVDYEAYFRVSKEPHHSLHLTQ